MDKSCHVAQYNSALPIIRGDKRPRKKKTKKKKKKKKKKTNVGPCVFEVYSRKFGDAEYFRFTVIRNDPLPVARQI